MRYLEQLNEHLNKVLDVVAGVALVSMMLVTVGNMFIRAIYVPFGGVSEVVGWLAAITTAFALGYTQIHRAHVEIDLVVSRFPKKVQAVVEIIINFLGALLFAIVTWQVANYGIRLWNVGILSETLRFSFYPITMGVAFGFGSLTLVLFADFMNSLIGVVKK